MPKLPGFMGGSDVQRSLNLSDNQCINLFPTTNDDGSVQAFYKVDGLKLEAGISGIATGFYKASNGRAFYVVGTTLFELINTAGVLSSVSRGTLTAGNYDFTDNGIDLIGVNGTDGWLFTFATNTLKKITVLTGTVTISIANPAVVTKVAHGLVAGDRVRFASTGTLPTGITSSTTYYVIAAGLTADTFQISQTSGGAAVITTASMSGTQYAIPKGICTISIANPAVITKVAHGLVAGLQVVFTTTGTLPTGITANTAYYVIATGLTADSFQISATVGGVAISTSGAQSGVHTFTSQNLLIVSIANGNAAVFTSTAHGFSAGTCLSFATTGSYPIGITKDVMYYVIATGLTANTFQVSLTAGGAAIGTYDQTGTQTFTSLGYGFPNGCKTVSYMNGRFIACQPGTQFFYVSEPLDGGWWDALNVQSADSNPDNNVGQIVSHNELIVFGELTGEVFYDSGSLPSPFKRNVSGVMDVGLLAPYSPAKIDNSIVWLGRSNTGQGVVYRLNGYTPMRISTYAIEYAIQSMTDASNAIGWTYQKDGHHFYVLNFPTGNRTFVYDVNTSIWHERASFNGSVFSMWEANRYIFFAGKHLVVDSVEAKIYSIDAATYSNGISAEKIVRSFRANSTDMRREIHHKLQIECEVGVGVTGGSDPQLMLRWSDDAGHTWSATQSQSLGIGSIGEYAKRVTFWRLGMTKGAPRLYELSCSADVKIVLLGAYLDSEGV